MADYSVKLPVSAQNLQNDISAVVEKGRIDIGNPMAAFAGMQTSMLKGFGLQQLNTEEVARMQLAV